MSLRDGGTPCETTTTHFVLSSNRIKERIKERDCVRMQRSCPVALKHRDASFDLIRSAMYSLRLRHINVVRCDFKRICRQSDLIEFSFFNDMLGEVGSGLVMWFHVSVSSLVSWFIVFYFADGVCRTVYENYLHTCFPVKFYSDSIKLGRSWMPNAMVCAQFL